MFCEMNGFWLFRLLVENPFEDYYICCEMMVGKIELRDCYEMMFE